MQDEVWRGENEIHLPGHRPKPALNPEQCGDEALYGDRMRHI